MNIINGKTFKGNSIVVVNGRVIVDGKQVDVGDVSNGILKIEVTGTLSSLDADGSVTCQDVKGDVDAGGSVSCGNVGGYVDAGGSVRCGTVGGYIDAGGSVRHG